MSPGHPLPLDLSDLLLQGLGSLQTETWGSDLAIIAADGLVLHAHTFVFLVWSKDLYHAAVYGHVQWKSLTSKTIGHLLRFMYTGRCILDPQNAQTMQSFAATWGLTPLAIHCQDYLLQMALDAPLHLATAQIGHPKDLGTVVPNSTETLHSAASQAWTEAHGPSHTTRCPTHTEYSPCHTAHCLPTHSCSNAERRRSHTDSLCHSPSAHASFQTTHSPSNSAYSPSQTTHSHSPAERSRSHTDSHVDHTPNCAGYSPLHPASIPPQSAPDSPLMDRRGHVEPVPSTTDTRTATPPPGPFRSTQSNMNGAAATPSATGNTSPPSPPPVPVHSTLHNMNGTAAAMHAANGHAPADSPYPHTVHEASLTVHCKTAARSGTSTMVSEAPSDPSHRCIVAVPVRRAPPPRTREAAASLSKTTAATAGAAASAVRAPSPLKSAALQSQLKFMPRPKAGIIPSPCTT